MQTHILPLFFLRATRIHIMASIEAAPFPAVGDVVLAERINPTEPDDAATQPLGTLVRLPEYNGREAMILRDHGRKIGARAVARVIRVDDVRGFIDLSARDVTADERNACIRRFNDAATSTA